MILLLGFAFISGLVTILAPCIWPLLPIILSSSIAGNGGHRRPLGITLGIMLSFTIFTLSVSYLVKFLHLDPNILRIFAVVVLTILGVAMIVPGFTKIMEIGISRLTSRFGTSGQEQGTGFSAGFLTGLSLGLVWSPCAGPILAAIATLAATGQVSFQVILVTLAYVTGVGIPLFIFAYAGQKFLTGSRKLSPYTGRIQQVFGVVMILTAVLIYTNKVQDFQVTLANRFPVLDKVFKGFEASNIVTKQLSTLKGSAQSLFTASSNTDDLFNTNTPAPEFSGINQWLNNPNGAGIESKPLTLADLKGKVVLVDFWTYTCINCVRTLPHVTSWYDKYKESGFVVIGVHTPEFAFEKETLNVQAAINKFKIHYPVAQDNDYATWNAYTNQYWPAEYLIDAKGTVRRTHFGEGEYDKMELAIQSLLKEAGKKVNTNVESMPDETPHAQTSPETYVGSKRLEYYVGGSVSDGEQTFATQATVPRNQFSYGGTWKIAPEYAEAGKNASLTYAFQAGHVYVVIKKGTAVNGKVKVILDGKTIPGEMSGKDVKDGVISIDGDRLYDIVDLQGKNEQHTLLLQFETPGLQAFAYTFG
jgi:cytochrome c biogenesis protein CcdA/thiol-disulfide isomerase/thioredoxin